MGCGKDVHLGIEVIPSSHPSRPCGDPHHCFCFTSMS
jgi:hypothetical protein